MSAPHPGLLATITVLLPLLAATSAHALSALELERLSQSRIAIEKDGDCDRAVALLSEMSEEVKQTNRWIVLAARAHACAGEYSTAIDYYEQLDARLPASPRRTRMIATLEARVANARPNRSQAAPRARDHVRNDLDALAMVPAAPAASTSRWTERARDLEGDWMHSQVLPSSGPHGETYRPSFTLEVESGRVQLHGQVFVESEPGEDRHYDGALQWFEIDAQGGASDEGVQIKGICRSKVWDFETAGVVDADTQEIAGTFVPRGRRGTMEFVASPLTPPGCGGDLGTVERMPGSSAR